MATFTLDPVPSPLTTPIGNNIDSAKTFARDYYKLSEPSIETKQLHTIRILGLLYNLAKLQPFAVNYKLNHKGLIQDAMVYNGAITMFNLEVAHAVTDWDAGKFVDTTLSNDVNALLQEGRDFLQLPVETQQRIISFLRVQLGT